MRFTCHLSFDGQCEAAFRTYQRVLGGEITTMIAYGESPLAEQVPADWQSKIVHATLKSGDRELFGSDAFPDSQEHPQGFSIAINLTNLDRARALFAALSEGGSIQMPFQETFWSPGFGVLRDRFGVPWEINCERTDEAGER